jgi:hypothetical protein
MTISVKEFSRLDRDERLAALRFVADRDGVESMLYRRLAATHQQLLRTANGQTWNAI